MHQRQQLAFAERFAQHRQRVVTQRHVVGEAVVVSRHEQDVEVRALFEDAFGNRGAVSAVSTATTVPVASVLALYNGGANDVSFNPSCASVGAASCMPCGAP